MQKVVGLNISEHNLDKLVLVARQVFLLWQAETISVPAETVVPIVLPFLSGYSYVQADGLYGSNGVSVSLMSYEGIEDIIDRNISEEAIYPPNVEIKKLSGGLNFI